MPPSPIKTVEYKWYDINDEFDVFFIGEATSGLFFSCYLWHKTTGKYYAGTKKITAKGTDLLKDFQVEIKQQ